jgi:hypothetical protein
VGRLGSVAIRSPLDLAILSPWEIRGHLFRCVTVRPQCEATSHWPLTRRRRKSWRKKPFLAVIRKLYAHSFAEAGSVRVVRPLPVSRRPSGRQGSGSRYSPLAADNP